VRNKREKGIALITALLILFLVAAVIVGMSWMVVSDQRLSGNNQDRQLAFYGAEAGMEKMTADMGNVFSTKGSITSGDLPAIVNNPPSPATMPGITYANASGSTYQIGCPNFPCVNPVSFTATIQPPSAFAGMQGTITSFTLRVASQTADGAEVKLQRQIDMVAIPVFQFGVFSNTDLAFFNGPPFDFGGRVHTNGNLWLAANNGPTYFRDKITASGQIIRSNLENGLPTIAGGQYGGAVTIALSPIATAPPANEPAGPSYTNAQWRALALTEGSMVGPNSYNALSGVANNPTWSNVVVPAYNGMLTDLAPQLNLISSTLGGLQTPVALIRRPVPGEKAANPSQWSQRYFTDTAPMTASLRIMLDDYPNAATVPGSAGACNGVDMLGLDSVSATTPVDLATLPNIAKSGSVGGVFNAANGYWQTNGTPTITGCLKIEYLTAAGVATDVTAEILAHGYRGRNLRSLPAAGGPINWVAPPTLAALPASGTQVAVSACADPDPGAVIRIERVRDNPSTGAGCGNFAALVNTDYWPNVLFDTREGIPRAGAVPGAAPGQITAVGSMYYIELDLNNLAKWFMGTLGAPDSGGNANNIGGYSVFFSDRRGNAVENQGAPAANAKVASLGYNDFVNSASANACPNGVIEQGEDIEGDGVLRTYGGPVEPIPPRSLLANTPFANNRLQVNGLCGGAPALWDMYASAQEARENPPFFFRRALKLVNGAGPINLGTACYGAAPNPPCGLTIASENPVYIQGDYNAPGGNMAAGGTIAASVAADAVTLLSDSWNDVNSFASPYNTGGRNAVNTSYRVALVAGKQIPFPQPPGEVQDFGTDGGLHNFLRYIENWGPATLSYEGSLVSFYYARQAVGLYKGGPVYSPPARNYFFDTTFVNGPQWLPPRTPTLRTVNTVGFSQMLSPTQ